MPVPCLATELGHNRRNMLTAGQRFFAVTAGCESGHELGTPQADRLGKWLLTGNPHYQHLENKSSDTGGHYCFTDGKLWHQDVTQSYDNFCTAETAATSVKLSGVSAAFTIPLFPSAESSSPIDLAAQPGKQSDHNSQQLPGVWVWGRYVFPHDSEAVLSSSAASL